VLQLELWPASNSFQTRYLSFDGLSFSIRDVCTRWRAVSEDDKIWFNLRYCPKAFAGIGEINSMLENMPALRQFHYLGTFNFIQKLCEFCKRVVVLSILNTTLHATYLIWAMRCLTELSELGIYTCPMKEISLLTRVIGQSETLVSLTLYTSPGDSSVSIVTGYGLDDQRKREFEFR
jgi:hypothetical protein